MLWPNAGKINTEATLKMALQRAQELNIQHLVLPSNRGDTAFKALELNSDLNLICVTHQVGFTGAGIDEMDKETRQTLTARGVNILTTSHLFAGVDRALRKEFGGLYPAEIIANTLRIMGQGYKVAIEISVMALDAGLIPYGKEIIALGGTARGVDTAIVIEPAHSDYFFNSQVKEIICMPRERNYKK
jgi:hypothetical protein